MAAPLLIFLQVWFSVSFRMIKEYSRYIIGIYLPGSLYSIIFLLYSWDSLFGVPSRVPLMIHDKDDDNDEVVRSSTS